MPKADAADVERAIAVGRQGRGADAGHAGYERSQILRKAAALMRERQQELGRTISREEGKILAEGVFEASRAAETIELSAEEAKRLGGEVLPLDGAPGGAGKFGFTLRVPCGVVVGDHAVQLPAEPGLPQGRPGPGGRQRRDRQAGQRHAAFGLEAGRDSAGSRPAAAGDHLPHRRPAARIGDALCPDPRVRKISFTGSRDVGEHICKIAGIKRVTMELGSNSPLIVMPDADLDKVAEATVATGFSNAGQVCISAQRVIAMDGVYGDLLSVLKPRVEAITTGNQLEQGTKMGPMIRERDAVRVDQWIEEAVSSGAKLLTGGGRKGTLHEPTLLADVKPSMRISCDELFGPAVAVTRVTSIDEAIALANDTRYGLSAGIFTQNLDWAMKFARQVDSGNMHINWGPQWRADLMPYGGLKESGFGKEGPKYAIHEMTEMKTVILHGV